MRPSCCKDPLSSVLFCVISLRLPFSVSFVEYYCLRLNPTQYSANCFQSPHRSFAFVTLSVWAFTFPQSSYSLVAVVATVLFAFLEESFATPPFSRTLLIPHPVYPSQVTHVFYSHSRSRITGLSFIPSLHTFLSSTCIPIHRIRSLELHFQTNLRPCHNAAKQSVDCCLLASAEPIECIIIASIHHI